MLGIRKGNDPSYGTYDHHGDEATNWDDALSNSMLVNHTLFGTNNNNNNNNDNNNDNNNNDNNNKGVAILSPFQPKNIGGAFRQQRRTRHDDLEVGRKQQLLSGELTWQLKSTIVNRIHASSLVVHFLLPCSFTPTYLEVKYNPWSCPFIIRPFCLGMLQSIYNHRGGPPFKIVKEEVFNLDEMIFEILVVFIVYILDRQILNYWICFLYDPISSRWAYMGLHRLRKSSKIT